MPHSLHLIGVKAGQARPMEVPVEDLVLAGWAGRDRAAVDAHIRELGVLGIAAPETIPVFYRVAASLVTTASAIQVAGKDSTGEVEFVLFHHGGEIWVGVGSDQTDRKAETQGITLSKQLCAKPISTQIWALSDVEAHWDELILRAYTGSNGTRTLYQEEKVSCLRHPRNLLELFPGFGPGTVLFSGTFAVVGAFGWAETFSMELEDPVLGRSLRHHYQIRALPVAG